MSTATETNPPAVPHSGRNFPWPKGKRGAVSLSFDDARFTQIDVGMEVLDRHNVRGTFYVVLHMFDKRPGDWKAAAARGHEIGNHTINHPCSGNFAWPGQKYFLEFYTLEQMELELTDASREIESRLGQAPKSFAYPCGQTFIGRGINLKSYVPLVAKHLLAGRTFRDECANVPTICDLSKLMGMDFDCMTFEQIKPHVDAAIENGNWLILVSHEVSKTPNLQTTNADALDKVCRYCLDRGVWLDTVANIAQHVHAHRV